MSRSIKGLLIKDLRLMISQMKWFFIMMAVWDVFMAARFEVSFFSWYISILCSFMTLGTFHYDEADNGAAYLFTLPVSRKDYISEKYVLGLLITMLPYLAANILLWLAMTAAQKGVHFREILISTSVSLLAAFLLLALEIPLYVRFGSEKGRLISLVCVGTMSALVGMIIYLNELAEIDNTQALSSLTGLSKGTLLLLAIIILAALLFISYKISCRFLEKREF